MNHFMTPRKPLIGLLWLSMASLPLPLSAQSTLSATTIEHTQFGEVSDQALAEHWKLSPQEIAGYRRYMKLEGRYFYAHLDPVMVLGIIETDPVQRARYAGLYLEAERERIQEQTRFANLVASVQLKRYGLEAPVDFSILPQVANSPGYQAARAGHGAAQAGLPASPVTPAATPAEPVVLHAGDRVDLLVEPGCETACYDKIQSVLPVAGVKIRLYGRKFDDEKALVAWLERGPLGRLDADARGRIEPRRFDPLIFSGVDISHPPVTLLRRNGAVVGTL